MLEKLSLKQIKLDKIAEKLKTDDILNTIKVNLVRWHTAVSFIKSFVRIISAAGAIINAGTPMNSILFLAGGIFIAEFFGILEELV